MNVEIKSMVRVTRDTWQLDWIETRFDRSGVPLDTFAWRGMFKLAFTLADPKAEDARSEDEKSRNPLGLSGPQPTAAADADQNRQAEKNEFRQNNATDHATSYVSGALARPFSPYELKAGSIIPVTLITGINSDLPGEVIGQVRESVYDTVTGEHLLIPQGSRLLARFDSAVSYGQERVLLCWNRLILPNGQSLGLECAPGVDLAGRSGFADEVDNHWGKLITGVLLSSLLGATSQAATGSVSGYQPKLPQLWAAGAASEVSSAGQQITRKNLGIQPTIKVRPGYSVNVLVSKDLILAPYRRM